MNNSFKIILTAGFAMFSMFFGSGNLVFPLTIGSTTLANAPYAIIGLYLTGVLVPFLGLIGVILFNGNRSQFLQSTGKSSGFLLAFFMLSLLGPFGVIPRCILVAFGGTQLFLPNLSLPVFSFIFSLVTLLLIWNRDRLIPIIGGILTPFLLYSVIILIFFGLSQGKPAYFSELSKLDSLKLGLFEGYQTMDLLAAFFFSASIVNYLRKQCPQNKLIRISTFSSILGASLIGVIYIGLVILGAKYAPALTDIHPEQYLAAIAGKTLGSFAIPVAAIAITLACLTTATILAHLFADFVHDDIANKAFSQQWAIIITLVISFLISLKGFSSIKIFLANILFFAYPALIALTLAGILGKLTKLNLTKLAFWGTLFASAFYKLI